VSKFIGGVSIEKINKHIPALSKVKLDKDIYIDVEILKNITYEFQILSPKIQIAAIRSKEIINTIFDSLSNKNGDKLLPSDFHDIYNAFLDKKNRMRTICDYIAGMTDRYAIEFYGRLKSENPQTIFKPY
jgi:dGTPase